MDGSQAGFAATAIGTVRWSSVLIDVPIVGRSGPCRRNIGSDVLQMGVPDRQ